MSRSRPPREASSAIGGGEAVTSSATMTSCDPPASTRVGEASRAIPAVGDGEVTTSSVAVSDHNPLASTRVGEARRAAPCRAMRTRRACRRGRLPRRDGGVCVSGLAPNGRMSVSWPSPVATKLRLPNRITVDVGCGHGPSAILETRGNEDKMSRSATPTWRANCRCPDPLVRHQLVMMMRVPSPRWLMQEATQ
jgi:hypothetical protein